MKHLKIIVGFWLILLSSSVFAQTTGWIENPNHPPVKTRLMLTGELDPVTKTLPAVLEVKLDGDWKTYWRTPGEGGIAPSIKWDKSTNLNHVEWSWPAPDKFSLLGMQTFGYQGEVMFPLLLTLDDLSANTQLHGKFTLSSCTTICVLTDYEINLDFTPNDLKADSDAMFAYNKAVSKVPQKLTQAQSADSIGLGWDSAKSQLEVVLDEKQW